MSGCGQQYAFPVVNPAPQSTDDWQSGLTKRQYYAAHAPALPMYALSRMAKVIRNHPGSWEERRAVIARMVAEWAWTYADAMIAAENG